MGENESMKPKEQETTSETSHLKKHQGRYSTEKTQKGIPQFNETETGARQSRGKKQRRQFKLAPNRG